MNDPIGAAKAVLLSARLNEMNREYAPALTPPERSHFKSKNPLRQRAALVGYALTSAQAIGAGMCEFDAFIVFDENGDYMRCVAPARVAIHVREGDMFEMVGTRIEGRNGCFFGVEAVHGIRM